MSCPCLYRPFVICPNCPIEQVLLADTDDGLFPTDPRNPLALAGAGGLRWGAGRPGNKDEAAARARYLCPHCGIDWDETLRLRLVRSAR